MMVSVLMTAYNRSEFIAQAIESVLSSTYEDFELIVVDDFSTDNTCEIARTYEIMDHRVKVYVNNNNLGDYPNRNKAASYASGKYIKYIDSDDIMYPHCLDVMVKGMEKYPGAGYGLSAVGDPIYPYPHCITPKQTYIENFNGYGHFGRAPGSSIIRKDVFEKMNGFSGKRMIGDTELWFKLARYFDLVKLPRDLVWDRVHNGQESKSRYAQNEYNKLRKIVLKEALTHEECPLNKKERNKILKSESINSIKQKIKKWL